MKRTVPARILVAATVFLSAALLAAATTYLYGGLFQHPRYYAEDGTIAKVQKIDIALISALLTRKGSPPLPDSQQDVAPLFHMLDGKLFFELRRGDRVVYSNRVQDKVPRNGPTVIRLADGAVLTIHRYIPPTWNSDFRDWLRKPHEWFGRKYDRITVPFLSLCLIYLIVLLALAWRHRARHLSDEVLAELRRHPEPQT